MFLFGPAYFLLPGDLNAVVAYFLIVVNFLDFGLVGLFPFVSFLELGLDGLFPFVNFLELGLDGLF